jgi:hypothetical protein
MSTAISISPTYNPQVARISEDRALAVFSRLKEKAVA